MSQKPVSEMRKPFIKLGYSAKLGRFNRLSALPERPCYARTARAPFKKDFSSAVLVFPLKLCIHEREGGHGEYGSGKLRFYPIFPQGQCQAVN